MTDSTPKYPYLHVDVPPAEGELASAILWELGAQGIEERDAHTLQSAEGADDGLTLVASFATERDAHEALGALGSRWPARVQFVIGDDWREAWRQYFKPSRVGRHLLVRPSWEPCDAGPNDVVLTLDPGCAFGTGTHASTRLVMAALEDVLADRQVPQLLDVGCGSGVLSIAALKLGVEHARCIDIDPDAARITLENAERNGVGGRVRAGTEPIDAIGDRYPLVLANIEASVLIPMAEHLRARLQPQGIMILSGILGSQAEQVQRAYASLRCLATPQEGDWTCLVLQQPPSQA